MRIRVSYCSALLALPVMIRVFPTAIKTAFGVRRFEGMGTPDEVLGGFGGHRD